MAREVKAARRLDYWCALAEVPSARSALAIHASSRLRPDVGYRSHPKAQQAPRNRTLPTGIRALIRRSGLGTNDIAAIDVAPERLPVLAVAFNSAS